MVKNVYLTLFTATLVMMVFTMRLRLALKLNLSDFFLAIEGLHLIWFFRLFENVFQLIVDMEERQQTDFTSNEPLFWDTGEPRLQLVITLLTEEKDDEDDEVEGEDQRGGGQFADQAPEREAWQGRAFQNAMGVATGFGALSLFINFVNLFQFLLAFMGGNRN